MRSNIVNLQTGQSCAFFRREGGTILFTLAVKATTFQLLQKADGGVVDNTAVHYKNSIYPLSSGSFGKLYDQ